MRLWSKSLVPLLPDEQLRGQWRECCAIASNLANDGTPNHLLVNRILEYPIDHFYTYCVMVRDELCRRRVNVHEETWDNLINNLKIFCGHDTFSIIDKNMLFENWMNKSYLIQCITNLREKYDCNGIELKDWFVLVNGTRNLNMLTQEEFDTVFG